MKVYQLIDVMDRENEPASTELGTQNLPLESKNKKDWLCFKKLREEIYLADPDLEYLMTASCGNRKNRVFGIYNADKNLYDAPIG